MNNEQIVNHEMTLVDIIHMLRQRWWIVALLAIISAAVSAFVSYRLLEPVYRAETSLFVGKESNSIALDIGEFNLNQRLVVDYREIIMSNLVADEVIEDLSLDMTAGAFKKRVAVTTIKDSRLFKISFESTDPRLAMDASNVLARVIKEKAEEIIEVKNVKLVDAAKLPQNPIKPDKKQNITIAGLLGLMMGAFLIIIMEYVDDTIKSKNDIERYLKLNVIGEIPLFQREKSVLKRSRQRSRVDANAKAATQSKLSSNLVVFLEPKTPASEAYRVLRTNIGYTGIDKKLNTIVVTSPNPFEGKSSTAANLAISLAQVGKKVLLLEADLRKPSVHKYFSCINDCGVTDIIAKDLNVEDAVKAVPDINNLYLICSGPLPPNPTEILESKKMEQLLEKLKNDYEIIIIDTPPVSSLTDAAIISKTADGVILVLASRDSNIGVSKHAKAALDNVQAKILGAVITKIDKYSGSTYYQRYYRYGSYYYDK